MSGPKGLLLYHGAGGNKDQHTLVALEDQLQLPVRRLNFPYRELSTGPRPPDRMPKLVAAIGEEAARAASDWGIEPSELLLGGRSMGGRACSVAHAEGLVCAGLVLLSYPLHPPRQPKKLRTEHFGDISAPVLIVQGNKDPFGTPAKFRYHAKRIAGPVELVWLRNANHEPAAHDDAIVAAVADWIERLRGPIC